MIQSVVLKHEFVECFPERLQPGILYISMEYASASHSCCCGCGKEVVTPFAPTEWKMTFDGHSVGLWPSIGNWNLPCRSHYIIRDGRAIEAAPWSDEQIVSEKQRDRLAKDEFYGRPSAEPILPASSETPTTPLKTNWFTSSILWIVGKMGV